MKPIYIDILKLIVSAIIGVIITYVTFKIKENRDKRDNEIRIESRIESIESNCESYAKLETVNLLIGQQDIKFENIEKKIENIGNKLDRIENILMMKNYSFKNKEEILWTSK